ncbi:LarC family nickel insertion protein [Acetohalobium arabaticum]|uniref:TIGR00299 family protein n=1 Tax=Acetohalobium arabaticum (strain ATCC 49924 / DSM 5501 / Z-7288) TaxID=574087 RepID=D9QS00_ACEAZ|nr:LarC family nickel insertion protein [Acetohalobium arabaticum]ADL13291.1 protein of unknown function DUF111 [Acetohalobium arabaticum DSM 5501]
MKVAYFDLTNGVDAAGILGAVIDLGWKVDNLRKLLSGLNLTELELDLVERVRVSVQDKRVGVELGLDSDLEEEMLDYKEVKELISSSNLDEMFIKEALEIFAALFKIKTELFLREVITALVYILGILNGIKMLKLERIYASSIRLGESPEFTVLELLKGNPVSFLADKERLVTELGAALVSSLVDEFNSGQNMILEDSGYGLITESSEKLRITLGSIDKEAEYQQDEVITVETNIDDMSQEFYDYIIQQLFKVGALDVYLTPIQMKKNRPAQKLTVLTAERNLNNLLEIIFAETTTLGVRINRQQRYKLEREIRQISLEGREVDVKLGFKGDKLVNIAPEYDSCKQAAEDLDLPLKEVYRRTVASIDRLDT